MAKKREKMVLAREFVMNCGVQDFKNVNKFRDKTILVILLFF